MEQYFRQDRSPGFVLANDNYLAVSSAVVFP
jgi:hypothetical protein